MIRWLRTGTLRDQYHLERTARLAAEARVAELETELAATRQAAHVCRQIADRHRRDADALRHRIAADAPTAVIPRLDDLTVVIPRHSAGGVR